MRKTLLALLGTLCSAAVFAGADVNTASVAELDGIKGIGPGLSRRILDERQHGAFKDWADLMRRVKGIKPRSAASLSTHGLTVGGVSFNEPDNRPPSGSKDNPADASAALPKASLPAASAPRN